MVERKAKAMFIRGKRHRHKVCHSFAQTLQRWNLSGWFIHVATRADFEGLKIVVSFRDVNAEYSGYGCLLRTLIHILV